MIHQAHDHRKSRILIIGSGLLGSSIYRRLKLEELDVQVTDREILNLLNQQELFNFFSNLRRETLIIFAAGVSGGIKENIENKFKFYCIYYYKKKIKGNLIWLKIEG